MSTTDTPSVRVDEALARFRDLQSQFERVRDRLRRAEEQKTTVSRRTFDKVRAEYDRELDALRAQMTPLRQELESHRLSIETGMGDVNATLESMEEELAEVLFRHKVGEYSDADLTEKRRSIEARLDAARARIAEQQRTLDMFNAMEESERTAAPAAPVAPAVQTSVQREYTDRPVMPRAPQPTPRAEVPPVEAEPAPVRRPVLRPTPAPTHEPVAPARAEAKTPPAGDFENPHDWIKEMGRDVTAAPPRRPAPAPAPTAAPTAARPRLGATPAASPATAVAGRTPAPGAKKRTPSLVFVNGAHAGESVPLLPTTLTIGREHDNNIELKDPDVARYHARIIHERGNYVVEDLDSTTGTWVNGQRTKRAPLNHGDVVRVGSTEIAIDFEWASDPV